MYIGLESSFSFLYVTMALFGVVGAFFLVNTIRTYKYALFLICLGIVVELLDWLFFDFIATCHTLSSFKWYIILENLALCESVPVNGVVFIHSFVALTALLIGVLAIPLKSFINFIEDIK